MPMNYETMTKPKVEGKTGPRLHYPSMEKLDDSAKTERLLHPGRATAKQHSREQIEHAVKLTRLFATGKTKEWLRSTHFGKDPEFISAVLKFGANDLPRYLDDCGVKTLDDDPRIASRARNELQGEFEKAIYQARNDFIQDHGPIVNDQHPIDSGAAVLAEVHGE